MIKIRNLKYSIQEKNIINDLDLELKENELLSILGPNGSGKSTLVKILCGVNKGYEGSIELLGRELKSYSSKELAQVTSYVPQFLEIHADYSVWDFMEMSLFSHMNNFRGLSRKERARAEEILNELNLLGLKDRLVNSLSGGERQKVFIASSIFQNPKVLLLDEPTSYLDPKHQDEVNEIIFSLRKRMSVVLVSHDINSSIINGPRILGLKEGTIVFDGTPKEILKSRELNKLFDQNFNFLSHPKKDIEFIIPKVFTDEN